MQCWIARKRASYMVHEMKVSYSMKLVINGRNVVVENGATVLDAARSIGVKVPTMCHLDGYPHFTSCMICVVKGSRLRSTAAVLQCARC